MTHTKRRAFSIDLILYPQYFINKGIKAKG